MKLPPILFIISVLLISSCTTMPDRAPAVFSRTKKIEIGGIITAQKNTPILSVTWKYSRQENDPSTPVTVELVDDCFQSVLIYEGLYEKSIRFRINNHICSIADPVSSNIVSVMYRPETKGAFTFRGMKLTILSADADTVHLECTPDDN